MPIIQNNDKIVSMCGQRLKALTKFVKTKTAMKISGQLVKPADLLSIYQGSIDTRAELISQRAVFNKALAARDSAEQTRQATDKTLMHWVVNEFGADSQEAQEFGFLPPKVGVKSAGTKAKAVEKTLATRKARGTGGKRQKEKIKGTIVAPAAPADPAITTPAAAPAASVTASTNGVPTSAASANGVAGSH